MYGVILGMKCSKDLKALKESLPEKKLGWRGENIRKRKEFEEEMKAKFPKDFEIYLAQVEAARKLGIIPEGAEGEDANDNMDPLHMKGPSETPAPAPDAPAEA